MIITDKLSEVSISYNPKIKASEMPIISTSQDAERNFRSIWSNKIHHVEEMYLLLLNRANRVLGYFLVSVGGTTGTVVDPKIIFQIALKANAHGIIIGHNHPSGSLLPSNEDISITKKIKEAGKVLEIVLLDHIILTAENSFSFADEGIL